MTTRQRARTHAVATVDEAAFDEAIEHIEMLAARLHAVLALHRPRPALLGPPKCGGCGRRWPCPTVRHGSRVARRCREPARGGAARKSFVAS